MAQQANSGKGATEYYRDYEQAARHDFKNSVPPEAVDGDAVEAMINQLDQESWGDKKVVFSQSHVTDTLVMKGTEVDLVLVPRKQITFGVFRGCHAVLATKNLEEMKPVMENGDVQAILLRYESGESLTTPDKTTLDEAVGFVCDDTKPEQSYETLAKTLLIAKPLYFDV